MRYMLMICDDESGRADPEKIEADPRFRAWSEEMDRRFGGRRGRPGSGDTATASPKSVGTRKTLGVASAGKRRPSATMAPKPSRWTHRR